MPRPYSMDLRERVVAAVEAGESRRGAARRFEISASSSVKWLQRVAQVGSVAPKRMGNRRARLLDGEREWLLARHREKPDLTLAEYRTELAERGVKIGLTAIWSFFRREGITFKKKRARERTGSA